MSNTIFIQVFKKILFISNEKIIKLKLCLTKLAEKLKKLACNGGLKN